MASNISRQACVKCDKGLGITTCAGCQKWFCTKHFVEHRQELAIRIDIIGQEHDLFQRDLMEQNMMHPLLTRVNQWEQQSIDKIRIAAEIARTDLQQHLFDVKDRIKISVNQLTNDLQSSRNTDDYTEIELDKWMKQLQEFRQALEKPTHLEIVGDEEQTEPMIRLIELRQKQTSYDRDQLNRLKVIDATDDDNSVVALSQEKIDELQMFRGDTVFVKGNNNHETICVVSANNMYLNECVQMNDVVQKNVGVHPGDFVSIRPCLDIEFGKRVCIKPTSTDMERNQSHLLDVYLLPYFLHAYRPVCKGDTFIVRANRQAVEFQVIQTDPDPYCIVSPKTKIICDDQA